MSCVLHFSSSRVSADFCNRVGSSLASCHALPCSGEGEAQPEEDATSGTAVMMSAFATAGGGVGVAYTDTSFRNLGLLQFQDTNALADLEGVVVQVRKPSAPRLSHVSAA